MADRNLILQLLITARDGAREILERTGAAVEGLGAAASNALAPLRQFGALIVAAVGFGGAKAIQDQSDAYVRLTNSLKVATDSHQAYQDALAAVVSIAERTNSDLETTASLYARVSQNAKAMNITQAQVNDLTELISKGMQLGGASAQEYASATLQLTQAFGSGVLRGEEFNAVMEASPELMRQLAKGLGVAIGELRGLAEQGVLTSNIVSQALLAQKDAIDQGYAKTTQTIEQAFTQMSAKAILFTGSLSQSTGAYAAASASIKLLAENLNVVAAAMGAALISSITKSGIALGGYVKQAVAARIAAREQAIASAAQERAAIASATANVAAAQAAYNRALAEQRLANEITRLLTAELGVSATEADVAAARLRSAAAANAAGAATQRYAAAQSALAAANTGAAASVGLLGRAMGFLAGPGGIILLLITSFAALLPMLSRNKGSTDELTASTDDYKQSLEKLNAVQLANKSNELLAAITEQNKVMQASEERVKSLRDGHQNLWEVMRDGRPAAIQLTEAEAQLAAEQAKLNQLQQNLRTTGDALNQTREQQTIVDGKMLVQYVQQGLAMSNMAKNIEELAKQYKEITDATTARISTEIELARASGDTAKIEAATLELAKEKARAAQNQAAYDTAAAAATTAKVAAMEQEYQGYQNLTPVQVKALADAKADAAAKLAQKDASAALAQQLQYQADHTLKLHTAALGLLEVMTKEAEEAGKNAALKQAQIDASIELAKAKGDEAKAAEKLAEKAALNVKDAQDEIARNKERVVVLDNVINKLYAEANAKGGATPEQQQYIQGLMDEANERKRTVATIEAKLPLMEREKQQAEIMAGPIGALTRLYADQTKEHERAADAAERYHDAQTQEAENALKLAQIGGDAVDIDRATVALNDQKIAQAESLAAARATEAQDAENALSAKTLELAADGELSKADKEQLADLAAVAAAKRAAADAAQAHTDQLREETDATRAKADADKKAAAEMKAAAESAQQLKAAGDGVNSNWTAANKVLEQTGGNMKILTAAFIANQEAATRNSIGWIDWATKTAYAADSVAQSYRDQKEQLDSTVATLQRFADEGGNVNGIQQAMIQSGGNLQNQYALLDEQDLDNLRGALADANQKLVEMQQEAQDAQDAIAALNAEIAAEKGDTDTADRLKLELDQRQALADVETRIRQAELQGNRDLVATLNEQKQKLEELYRLKEKNLEADIKARQQPANTNTTTNTSSSGGTSGNNASRGGGGSSLTVNVSGGVIDSNFADQLARAIKPKLDEIARRSN